MEYALPAIVAAVFTIGLGQVWLRRRREAPLRWAIRSQKVTFWISLNQVKEESPGWPRWLALNSMMALYVRGDSVEISSMVPPIRVLMGMEYYFKARETFVEISKEPSMFSALNWIVITGSRRGREIKVAIMKRNEIQFFDAWNALVVAGAVPIGPPRGVRILRRISCYGPMPTVACCTCMAQSSASRESASTCRVPNRDITS